ncbi:hypothetical protein UFOVP1290_116 [uncultured Caudovirales phage]|uniref:Uncharacterized protein n=1 Tax=uncultured Caudovirales phage TaxID=2100421 RepID=A0A6J5RQN5_9CAUD|nr:hypothetical protein UFOVP1290_116 [uncultured Caudovirales phage]
MTTLADFNKAVARSAVAYGILVAKNEAYTQAYQEMQAADAENNAALEEVKSLVKTLDADAIKAIQESL